MTPSFWGWTAAGAESPERLSSHAPSCRLHTRKVREDTGLASGSCPSPGSVLKTVASPTSHTVFTSRGWAWARLWRWALTMCRRLPCSVKRDQVKSCSSAQVMGTSTSR